MQTSPSDRRPDFPDGRSFAFTIIDDTDVSTLENIRPFYELLTETGLRTTKTVWPLGCPEGSPNFGSSTTLEDPPYLEYVRTLQARGFEITWHGATMESSDRERTLEGIERMRALLDCGPRVHANHALNRENLYWGVDRLDDPFLRFLFGRMTGVSRDHYRGHVEGSKWWWGDTARDQVEYARNLTFREIDTLRVNPSMPYHDPNRPLVPMWFSATDAEDVEAFVELLQDRNLDRLERSGGVCIVATHVGKGFAPHGRLDPRVEDRIRALAVRPGWFVPVGRILDWLRERSGAAPLPPAEWRAMQWRWAFDTLALKVKGALSSRFGKGFA
jgi:hypothetical protein